MVDVENEDGELMDPIGLEGPTLSLKESLQPLQEKVPRLPQFIHLSKDWLKKLLLRRGSIPHNLTKDQALAVCGLILVN